jgi:hypothetical protein
MGRVKIGVVGVILLAVPIFVTIPMILGLGIGVVALSGFLASFVG